MKHKKNSTIERLCDIIRKSKRGAEKTICDVDGCENKVKRSLSTKKVKKALPDLKFKGESSNVHLCKDHYRDFKKATKKDRKLETLTWK